MKYKDLIKLRDNNLRKDEYTDSHTFEYEKYEYNLFDNGHYNEMNFVNKNNLIFFRHNYTTQNNVKIGDITLHKSYCLLNIIYE
jgi:hypothetical protein